MSVIDPSRSITELKSGRSTSAFSGRRFSFPPPGALFDSRYRRRLSTQIVRLKSSIFKIREKNIGPLCNLVKFQHRYQFGHRTLAKALITFEWWSCCRSHPFATFRPSISEGAPRTENPMSEMGYANPHVAFGTFVGT